MSLKGAKKPPPPKKPTTPKKPPPLKKSASTVTETVKTAPVLEQSLVEASFADVLQRGHPELVDAFSAELAKIGFDKETKGETHHHT